MATVEPSNTKLRLLLREPTLHFFLIALAIFAVYGITRAGSDKLLEIDQREIDARIFMREMAAGEALTDEQRQFITSLYVEEQILVQEAIALGLDNDARIHDVLAQKMRHVLSGDVIQPSAGELEAYYQANPERYRTLPTVSVDELVFNTRQPLAEAVIEGLDRGAESEALLQLEAGDSAPLPDVNRIDLANIFDPTFSDTVFASAIGRWNGPFISNRGQHWLRVTEKKEESLPALADITDRVRLDWITDEEEVRLQAEIDKLWQQYTIIINDAEQ